MSTTFPLSRRTLIGGGSAVVVGMAATWRTAAQNAATPGAMPAGTPASGMVGTGTPGSDPSARIMADGEGGVGGLYLSVSNTGPDPDHLMGGQTTVCRTVEPHTMKMVNGVMVMEYVPDGLEVPPGQILQLTPDGNHLMLIDLTQDLKPSSTFTISLIFQRAGTVEVTSAVRWTDKPGDNQASAGPVALGDLTISDVWSRPAPKL